MVETTQQFNQGQTAIPPPPMQESRPTTSKSKSITLVIIFLCILLVLGIGGYVLLTKIHPSQSVNGSIISPTGDITPTPEIIDTAPAVSQNQKAKVLVHNSDSTYSIYLVPIQSVSAYTQTLPQGDVVVNVTNP